jgi:hypothetical protein
MSGPAPSYPNNLHRGGEDTGPNQPDRGDWLAKKRLFIRHVPVSVARHAQELRRTFARRALLAEEAFSLAWHVDLTPQDVQ